MLLGRWQSSRSFLCGRNRATVGESVPPDYGATGDEVNELTGFDATHVTEHASFVGCLIVMSPHFD
jgi:hypothetical protein